VASLLESQGTEASPASRKSTRTLIASEMMKALLDRNPTCIDCNEKGTTLFPFSLFI
jgi:hypothetical protein